jgi:hypothetical protein
MLPDIMPTVLYFLALNLKPPALLHTVFRSRSSVADTSVSTPLKPSSVHQEGQISSHLIDGGDAGKEALRTKDKKARREAKKRVLLRCVFTVSFFYVMVICC